jgi:hypothetical protein
MAATAIDPTVFQDIFGTQDARQIFSDEAASSTIRGSYFPPPHSRNPTSSSKGWRSIPAGCKRI